MKKTFHEILAEKDDEFTYYVRSTVDIHNPEYFERVKMTLMPYRIKDISVDTFRPLSKDNKTFPDQPNHATYSVRVVTGLPVDTKKVLETMAMICHIHISHLNIAPEDDVESMLPGKPIEVDKTTSQALVGHQRLGEFMKELQKDRRDREKKFVTREVYESFFTTHRALESALKKGVRKGYYMVEMCRDPDGQTIMRAEGPFGARPDGNQYRDSFSVKSASILSESTTGGMYGVQAVIELQTPQSVDEKMFEVAVSDMNSGRRYTAMVRANSAEIAREAAVTQVADAHRLDPSGLTAMAPKPANTAPQMWTEAEMSGIQNPNSSGQGHDPSHEQHPLHGTITGHGYQYSHSTPIKRQDGSGYTHHTYHHPANPEHKVGVGSHDPHGWDTTTTPSSGRQMRGTGSDALSRHLVGKRRRHGLR